MRKGIIMIIRTEKQTDFEAVERLTYEAFSCIQLEGRAQTDEHLLIHKMRSVSAFIPQLSLVCEIDGCIVGHIAYTKSKVVTVDGQEHEVITFGPLSVLPRFQNQGIGAKLVCHSLEEAKRLGYKAVLITGHPKYYPKFGFVNAEKYGITLADGSNMDAFMALELVEDALYDIHGKWIYDPVFEIDREELALFNKENGYCKGE